MTLVHFDLRRGNFTDPIEGSVWITPIKRIHVEDGDDDFIVLTDAVEYVLTDGQADIDMVPSDVDWAWVVTEAVPTGIVRYVAVPDQAEAEYGDLQDIDPATLDPAAEPIAAWWTAAANAVAAAQTATDAADSAALSLSLTEQYADNASIFAEQAAQSATTANSSRINAGLARTGAETAQIAAETARTGAETAQSGAQTARSGAETAQTAAEAARDASLAGQFAGSPIGSNTNLNDITTPGVYFQSNAAYPTLAKNYPRAGAGYVVEVFRIGATGTAVVQNATIVFNTNPVAERGYYTRRQIDASAWSVWAFIPTLRVTNPVDQPGITALMWDDSASVDRAIATGPIPMGTFDLNAMTLSGTYIQANAQGSDFAARNYPIVGALGVLVVVNTTNTVFQRFTQTGAADATAARGDYIRRQIVSSGIWSPWRFVASQRFDQTAGRALYTQDELNSREQLIWGDTGHRTITSLLPVGSVVTAIGGVLIRRVGSTVEITVYGVNKVSGAEDWTAVIPAGFRPPIAASTTGADGGSGTFGAYVDSSGFFRLRGGSVSNGIITLMYTTTNNWPTTLPGTPYTAIPNL